MISRLEKLLVGITAALAINCGEEPTSEQCREGREWNGSACIAVGYDAGRDQVDEVIDLSSEEPEPECYTHQGCGDDYLCVEGSCESIEEACAPNPDFDGCGMFEGLYEIGCIWTLDNQHPSHLYFQPLSNCGVAVIALESVNDDVPLCFTEETGYTRTPQGNELLFPQEGDFLVLCSDQKTIRLYTGCLLEKVQNPPDLSGFIEHCLYL